MYGVFGGKSVSCHRAEESQVLEAEFPDTTTTATFVDTILKVAPNPGPGPHAVDLTEAAYRMIAGKQIVHVDVAG